MSEINLVRVKIDEDEEYPFYRLHTTVGTEVEISVETLERWERVLDEYQKVKEEIKQYIPKRTIWE